MRRKPRVRLEPIQSGGGQERGMRSGTLPAPLIVGLGAACRVILEEMENDRRHVEALSRYMYERIMSQIELVALNGDRDQRYPGNMNFSFRFVEGESLLMALKACAVSSGSACTSASLEPSYVLRALGVEEDMAHTSIRIGIGRFTTKEEVDHIVNLLVQHVGVRSPRCWVCAVVVGSEGGAWGEPTMDVLMEPRCVIECSACVR